jgi:hypothetical protein
VSLKTRRRVALILAVLLPLAAIVLHRFPPTQTKWYPRCRLYTHTKLHCPGCGTARCLHALTQGHLAQALAYNALTVAVLPFLAAWLVGQGWTALRGTAPPPNLLSPRACWAVVAVVIAFGVLRNVPVYPLTLLAPTTLPPPAGSAAPATSEDNRSE